MNTSAKTIVLAIFTLQGNGAERFALTLAKGLVNMGHHAHIVYFKQIIDLPVPEGVKLHFFDYQKYRILPKFMRATIVANAFDKFVLKNIGAPDLVLSNLFPVDFILHKSKLPNIHLVIHNTMSEEYKTADNKQLNQLKQIYLSKPCIGVSQGVTDDFKKLFGDNSRITTIYNPIDVEEIINTADEFTIPYQNYIVHVGKFKAQKRHDNLIHAYAQSNQQKMLVLVGTGDLQTQNQQLVKQLGIEDKVIFVGFQKNPYPWIKYADFMVLSSDFEGLGLVILEALALNTPVISTDCPSGPAEILPANNLVAIGNITQLAEKINQASVSLEPFQTTLKEQFTLNYATKAYLNLIKI